MPNITKLQDLIDPQVMADMVSAKLPKAIKFSPIAKIDTTLEGRPGSTITIPKFAYIGDAIDVAEGEAVPIRKLTASTTQATIKKAGNGAELTDEAVLSGYGDPVGECAGQLTKSVAAKVDNDSYDALCDAKTRYDGSAAVIGYEPVVNAVDLFQDENDEAIDKIIFVHPTQVTTLRKDPDFLDMNKYPITNGVIMTGMIGMIAGCRVVKSKKVKAVEYEVDAEGTITIVADSEEESSTAKHLETIAPVCAGSLKVGDKVKAVSAKYYACPIVTVAEADPDQDPAADGNSEESPALTIYLKRDVNLESDRDIVNKTTVFTVDEHYVAALTNDSKVVLAKFKA